MSNHVEHYIPELVSLLRKNADVEKVILFGSAASGATTEDSDIDLLVVLRDDSMPTTFAEKMNNKSRVREVILPINRKAPIDLLVYTKPEFDRFLSLNSSFAREIRETGKVLFERVE